MGEFTKTAICERASIVREARSFALGNVYAEGNAESPRAVGVAECIGSKIAWGVKLDSFYL
jgi:hypothetical protein